ncbi:MAG: PKD domain-containing protein [Gammaproteobacteria bacterium]|nr:PKD domain-containing protein [Gammaproteobacteria bacterium]MBL6999937.1 PKD domain-containing protein [Gammaproteobacteria bacterium]
MDSLYWFKTRILLLIVSALLINACGGGGGSSNPAANNQPPIAVFTANPDSGTAPLAVSFNASASSDNDGSIVSYIWDFGDGSSASGVNSSNTFVTSGSYTVKLTLTDDDGATALVQHAISVAAPNQSPIAAFTSTPDSGISPLRVNFDAAASFDLDGSIASYAWDFGDGKSASGVSSSNTFLNTGSYTVSLTVTDNDGATDSSQQSISVQAISVDTTPPTISFSAPIAAATLSGAQVLSANATDQSGIDRVDFLLDGTLLASAVTSPFQINLNTAGYGDGAHTLTAVAYDAVANSASDNITVTLQNGVVILPSAPETVATVVPRTETTQFADSTAFLYAAADPIQTGVIAGTIQQQRVAVLRGKVLDRSNVPVSGVNITVLDHPEFGQTVSRSDGLFDMAVNGGGVLTVNYRKAGYLPVQRQIDTPWQDYIHAEDVIMISKDPQLTAVDLTSSSPMQVAQGSVFTDKDGSRQATVFIPQGTQAQVILADGSLKSVNSLNISLTEYTVGDSGPDAMPGKLPPTSAYTYAFEISAEEAVKKVNGKDVIFNRPIPIYVDNFIGFPVGINVPVGFYDNDRGVWVPSESGRIIQVISITAGKADVDVDGDGVADSGTLLSELGITDAELSKLAELYAVNDSLWRFRVDHFSTIDCNWAYRLANDAKYPKPPKPPKPPKDPCKERGSIIECQSQTLGEEVRVSGTPFSLNYRSDRVTGNKTAYTIDVPISDAIVPVSLLRIDLNLTVAGKTTWHAVGESNQSPCSIVNGLASCTSFNPLIIEPLENQSYRYTWDGKDAYGRTLQGRQPVTGRIGYTYVGGTGGGYQNTEVFAASGTQSITQGFQRELATLWQEWSGSIGLWDEKTRGLGAWSLSEHHVYDPFSQILYKGDGSQRSAGVVSEVITTVAGDGTQGYSGDGGPATKAQLDSILDVAVGADGSLYIASGGNDNRIRRVGPDGIITTVAGNGGDCTPATNPCGDGGPATDAQLFSPSGIAIGSDTSLYIADRGHNKIRRVGPDGIITTVAGNGEWLYRGDGVLATSTSLFSPMDIAIGADGSLYIAEQGNDSGGSRVRRVTPDGIINTVAGTGTKGYGGDGDLATAAYLYFPSSVSLGPDGSLYIADLGNRRIRRVSTDGIISTVAGNGLFGNTGDGGLATQAKLGTLNQIDIGPDGSLYISNGYFNSIRHVGLDGIINSVAGAGDTGACYTDATDLCGDGGLATNAHFAPTSIALAPGGSFYIGESLRVRRVGLPLTSLTVNDIFIPSEDSSEIFHFDSSGRHLQTIHALTSAVLYQFEYDVSGLLIAIEDGDKNRTTIERTFNGDPVAIIAPFGQRTDLSLDANGYLASITNPANEINRFSYSVDGLLETMIDPLNRVHTFSYDTLGRLIKDEDPAGGFKVLKRTELADGYEVSVTTALDRVTIYRSEDLSTGGNRTTKIEPTGAVTDIVIENGGKKILTSADGTITTIVNGPDPRFGMLSPVLKSLTVTSPGNITRSITSSRTATLTDQSDLLSLQNLQHTLTENSQTYVYDYDAATRSFTTTTPAGHQTVTQLDTLGRAVNIALGTGVDPIVKTYDVNGRIVQARQGAQYWNYGYDLSGRISSRTDAANNVLQYDYDNADRISSMTLAEGGVERYGYDANGNQTRMTMPSGDSHTLAYSVRDLLAAYTPPTSSDFSRVYDLDRSLVRLTLPSGRITLNSFDTSGRNTRINYPEAMVDIGFNDTTDRVSTLTRTPTSIGLTQQLDFSYDGEMVKSMQLTGAANGSYQYLYDNNFRINQITLTSGTDTVQQLVSRDADGQVTGFGGFTLTRTGPGGSLTRVNDSKLTHDITYDTLRRVQTRTDKVNTTQAYSFILTRDVSGWISQKTETVAGVTKTYDYSYDKNGQLIEVKQGAAIVESYSYDVNGNRLSHLLETASYDSQDRLTRHGTTTYQFDLDGFLAARGSDSFQYSARGELLRVILNSGAKTISYSYDGLGRRVARTDNMGSYQYLYGNPDNPVLITASRDPADVLTTFYYDDDGLLFAFERGSKRYYVSTDQVGSPRVVSDATGSVIKTIVYDAFGRRISDSNPEFDLQIGFAGGLEDTDTALVRFGFRDYEQISGRWAARDPILYEGGQINLYVYVGNNPLSQRDPLGLWCVGGSAYLGVGGGAQFCCSGGKCSICGELGVGIGGSVEVGSGNASNSGATAQVEVGASCGPLSAGIKCGVSTDPCSTDCEAGAGVGPLGISTKGEAKASHDLIKTKCGLQARLAARACGKF